jgi:hypothetical protein
LGLGEGDKTSSASSFRQDIGVDGDEEVRSSGTKVSELPKVCLVTITDSRTRKHFSIGQILWCKEHTDVPTVDESPSAWCSESRHLNATLQMGAAYLQKWRPTAAVEYVGFDGAGQSLAHSNTP